jgi:GNAT superfamily N-acetyltransferase
MLTRVVLAARGMRGEALERQVAADIARFREQGLVPMIESDGLIAVDGERIIGVMRYGEFEGDVHLTRPEIDPEADAAAAVGALLREFWTYMREGTRRALFVDYPRPNDGVMGPLFLANGFEKLIDRLDMRMQLRTEMEEPVSPRLTFASFSEHNEMRFFRAFKESFAGSLDPMMDWDAHHPELSFEMFRFRFGQFEPEMWVLATDEQGCDVGFAMFQHFPGGRYAGDHVLLYTAVVPEARGLGYGEEIVREGLRRIRKKRGGTAHVSLTVSKSNRPAARIYHRLGFSPVEEFSVYKMERF